MPDAAVYDPRFDPLTAREPAACSDYAPTYWVATAGAPPPDDGRVTGDMDVDVAVIGAGFTGLACALFLAREHGIRATVLEANGVAWGCTSRNGGQGQLASGRLYRSQWIERWGRDIALRLHAEILEGFETFRELVREIDCDAREEGHLLIAHRRKKMDFIRSESSVMNRVFGCRTEVLDRDAVHARYVNDAECQGALFEPDGICVHPLKLAYGYLRKAREAGARVHTASPVLDWVSHNGVHRLRTPGGTVRARAVAVATGAYAPQTLHPLLRGRIYPVLSNSIVTRVLEPAELDACKLETGAALTDTRTLRYYYRRLPDGRLQIGSRSAVTGADAQNPVHLRRLTQGLAKKFPALARVPIEYSWWGWVDVSHDMMPRVARPDAREAVHYALGYGGNGVSYSAQAGRRMAQRIAGRGGDWDLPIFDSALPAHPLAPLRRLGQRMLYVWHNLRDEVL
ncbi:MAG TPA: FAD-binding oxidoreductase [Burkholderiales bacterium]|nr:FAD-binding oxidoreductase [Burkholderiales bacterium]